MKSKSCLFPSERGAFTSDIHSRSIEMPFKMLERFIKYAVQARLIKQLMSIDSKDSWTLTKELLLDSVRNNQHSQEIFS